RTLEKDTFMKPRKIRRKRYRKNPPGCAETASRLVWPSAEDGDCGKACASWFWLRLPWVSALARWPTHAYAGWAVLEVMSSDLQNFERPSHINFLSFDREKGATVLAVSQDELPHFAQKLADEGVAFEVQSRDLSQLLLTPLPYGQIVELPKGVVTFDRYMNYKEVSTSYLFLYLCSKQSLPSSLCFFCQLVVITETK
ncbi:uncharacterized protein LOC119568785, partial [Penaeus monodon]|uniref:uncharacterized protein LOC119568785 n=1 Tax=Penaeus monodon TaxID=6687 RepID=UPI0018A7592B